MAYVNLIAVSCTNRADVFKRFRDFVCKRAGSYDYSLTGIGWTLHDAVYAVDESNLTDGDYIVVYSPGESGDDDMYFKVLYSSGYIIITGYLYWDAASHTGVHEYNSTQNWTIADGQTPYLYIYGDLDQVLGISRETGSSANYNPVFFGRAQRMAYDSEVAVCAASLTSGSNRVIDVGTVPSHWLVGQNIYIRDTANIDIITISAKTASTITATLSRDYLAGAKLASDVGYFVSSLYYFYSVATIINHAGTKNYNVVLNNASSVITDGSPEVLNSDRIAIPWYISDATGGYLGQLKNIYKVNSGISNLSILADGAGKNYRAFTFSNGISPSYHIVMEV